MTAGITPKILLKNVTAHKVTERTSETINVGGLKFIASEVERVSLQFEGLELAKAEEKPNPITGQHIERTVQPALNSDFDKTELKPFFIP